MKSLDDAILSARNLFIKPSRRLNAFLVCGMAAFLLVLALAAINGSTLQENRTPTADQSIMWRFLEYKSAVEEPADEETAEPPTQIAIPWDSFRVVCSDLGWTLVESGTPSDLDLAVNTSEGAPPLEDVLYVESEESPDGVVYRLGLYSANSAQQKLDLLRERVELEWSESRLSAAEYSLVKLRRDSGNTQREVSAAIERLNSYLEAYFIDVIGRIEELTLLAREPSLPEIVNGKGNQAPSEATQILTSESSYQFSTVEAVRALVDQLDQQREELLGYLTNDHPSIRAIDEKLSLALSHLDQALANSSEQDAGNRLAPDQNAAGLGGASQLPRLFVDSKTHQKLSLDKILERELEARATIESLFADYDQATQRHFEVSQQERELLANLWSQRRIETMEIDENQSELKEPMNPFGTTWTIIAAIAALATGGVASIVSSPDPTVIETISHAQFALPIPLIGAVAASGFAPREKHLVRMNLGRWIVRGAEATLIVIAICLVVYLLRTPGAWDIFFNSPAKAYIAVVESMLG